MKTAALLFLINFLIVAGDVFAKQAATSNKKSHLAIGAVIVWMIACLLWIPLMKVRGFTRLIALADVVGLLMAMMAGFVFLNETLSIKEYIGIGFAIFSIALLA